MFEPDENGIYAIVQASQSRRVFAYVAIFMLGALVIYTALARPPAWPWLVFMLAFGVGALWLAERLRRATRLTIELTETDIRDSSGVVLAHMDEIARVDRGAFAFKPSNGFTLIMNTKRARGWAPGLWWRLGRRVGVGGVTSAGQAKFMAEQIALRINTKDG